MQLHYKIIFFIFLLLVTIQAQLLKPGSFQLGPTAEGSVDRLLGNAMVDMVTKDYILFAGSGYGLNRTYDGGSTWTAFTSKDFGGKNGITAITFMDDSTLWIATSFDTSITDVGELPAGSGLSYTRDNGRSWSHVPQPIDPRTVTDYKPTTTNVQNLIFDIAILDSTIWIASFGGGLRRSEDMGSTWHVVTTDGIPFSALDYLNHRAFSVMSENGNLWVGTAAGISRSSDGGNSWRRFTSKNQEFPISGNFIVALAYQSEANTIWAATIETDSTEIRAVSKSINGGESWEVVLEGVFAHNFAFDGQIVYVAADEGLFLSNNGGESWYTLPPLRDNQTGEEILSTIFYSAGVSYEAGSNRLWAGSADGLATTSDNGNTWQIFRSFQSTRRDDTPDVYAYPSPFAPSEQGFVRFQYDISRAGEVVIEIFNFAMEKVATIRESEAAPAGGSFDRSARWDGRTSSGNIVASGVYFFRVKVEGKVSWGKLVIINSGN